MLLRKPFFWRLAFLCLMSFIINGCYYHPPFNNFKPYNRSGKDLVKGAAAGALVGAGVGFPVAGLGIGAAAFTLYGLQKDSHASLLRDLQRADIQYEQYGDTFTLIIPTDRYFLFNLPRFNQLCYRGLVLIIRLLKLYPNSTIYVAGFTDDVGSRHHKNMLSQARAETMLTFLWANNISAERLHAEGYGDKYAISDNRIIHGSAQNRRLEIQWFMKPSPAVEAPMPYLGPTK